MAHTLLGTIYLPRGMLFLDAERPISNRAAYTIIIAYQVQMISGPGTRAQCAVRELDGAGAERRRSGRRFSNLGALRR